MTTQELFADWFGKLQRGEKPVRYRVGVPFNGLDIRPGRLYLFGGAPGMGKTAALLQVGIDLLRLNPEVRLLIANVEMAAPLLVDRIFARLAGVPLTTISDRETTPQQLQAVQLAYDSLGDVLPRLHFLTAPYSLENVAKTATEFKANVLILDYIQRFAVAGTGDKREQLETSASVLRGFCDEGAALLVASAVARQKTANGSGYVGLNLASFRGSSELEYGTDAAYLFNGEIPTVTLNCEKNRFGEVADIVTRFDPKTQSFTCAPSGLDAFDDAKPASKPKNKKGAKPCDN